MLVKEFRCDICSKPSDKAFTIWAYEMDTDGNETGGELQSKEISDALYDEFGNFHICNGCLIPLVKKIRPLVQVETEPTEEKDPIDDECGLPFVEPETPRKPKKERTEMLSKEELEILINSKPIVDIATQCGCTDKTIRNWCAKYGIKIPRHYRKKDC